MTNEICECGHEEDWHRTNCVYAMIKGGCPCKKFIKKKENKDAQ